MLHDCEYMGYHKDNLQAAQVPLLPSPEDAGVGAGSGDLFDGVLSRHDRHLIVIRLTFHIFRLS